MARESLCIGHLKLRQQYNRQGYNYFVIGVPASIVQFLGWEPGRYLTYYPTKDKGLKLRMEDGGQMTTGEDLDPRAIKQGEPVRGVRPGSMAARALEVESELEGFMKRLGAGDIDGAIDLVREQVEAEASPMDETIFYDEKGKPIPGMGTLAKGKEGKRRDEETGEEAPERRRTGRGGRALMGGKEGKKPRRR